VNMSWPMSGPEGDSQAVRTVAFQQRDTAGVLHPGTEDDYDAAISHQWGGPAQPRWFDAAVKLLPTEHAAQRGRRVLITGGSGGVGFYVAKLLAAVGLVVVLPARPDLQFETQGAAAAIRAALPKAIVEVPDVPLDLASYESVRAFGEHMRTGGSTIDVLCLNAARGGSESDKAEVTADDHEATMQVNLLSHALLVHELLPNLRRSSNARIVVHSSGTRTNAQQSSLDDLVGKRRSTNPFSQYILSKAGLCLFARALNSRLGPAGVRGVALIADPGFAATGINYQHNIAVSLRLSRRGFKDTRGFHDAHASHAADAALPMVKACLLGEANDVWMGEMVGPRASSLDAAAHLAGYLFWPPLQRTDPMHWDGTHVERLWKQVGTLIGKGELEAPASTSDVPTGSQRPTAHDEL